MVIRVLCSARKTSDLNLAITFPLQYRGGWWWKMVLRTGYHLICFWSNFNMYFWTPDCIWLIKCLFMARVRGPTPRHVPLETVCENTEWRLTSPPGFILIIEIQELEMQTPELGTAHFYILLCEKFFYWIPIWFYVYAGQQTLNSICEKYVIVANGCGNLAQTPMGQITRNQMFTLTCIWHVGLPCLWKCVYRVNKIGRKLLAY